MQRSLALCVVFCLLLASLYQLLTYVKSGGSTRNQLFVHLMGGARSGGEHSSTAGAGPVGSAGYSAGDTATAITRAPAHEELPQEQIPLASENLGTNGESRTHDFIFCANIADTLGSALQALRAFLTLAYKMQERGYRVRVNLPALGKQEFDQRPLHDQDGTSLATMLDISALREILDIDADVDAKYSTRQQSCWHAGRDVVVNDIVEIESDKLKNTRVPHEWLGPGMERFLFEQLFDNLGALANTPGFAEPIRVFWEMQSYSPTQCAAYLYNTTARKVVEAMVLKPAGEEDDCAFVFVRKAVYRNKIVYLNTLPKKQDITQEVVRCNHCYNVPLPLAAVGVEIGKLLQAYKISCAKVYVKLLGLQESDFLDTLSGAAKTAGYPFTAKRVHKAPCGHCMGANMETLQAAARSPLLVSEFGTYWSDLAAANVLALGQSVAYLYSGAPLIKKKRAVRQVPNVSVHIADCKDGLIFRGDCVREFDPDPNFGSQRECWPDAQPL